MKNVLNLACLLVIIFSTTASAAVREIIYDGSEILIETKREHLTAIQFPEPINRISRGKNADTYIVNRGLDDLSKIEVMPEGEEEAQATFTGVSGETYVTLFSKGDKGFDTKVTIKTLSKALKEENEPKESSLSKIKEQPPVVVKEKEEKLEVAKMPSDIPQKKENEKKEIKRKSTLTALNTKISLKINKKPLSRALSYIANLTGYNLIFDSGVEDQEITASLNNVEAWRALNSILHPLTYGYKVNKSDLYVLSKEKRVFNVNVPQIIHSFSDTTSNEATSSSTANSTNSKALITTSGVGASISVSSEMLKLSVWDELEKNLNNMKTEGVGRVTVNRMVGKIIAEDSPTVLDEMGRFIEEVNYELSKQQTFEIKIMKIKFSENQEIGIDWAALASSIQGLSLTSTLSDGGFSSGQLLTFSAAAPHSDSGTGSSGISAVIKALEERGDVEVISKPSIMVSNRVPCIIQEGKERNIEIKSGTITTNGVAEATTETIPLYEGLTLRIFPIIGNPGEKTNINLALAVTSIDSIVTSASGIDKYVKSNKNIETTIGVYENRSVIIGGLISTSKTTTKRSVPGLSKVPFLGRAFQYNKKEKRQEELVIIITPFDIITNRDRNE